MKAVIIKPDANLSRKNALKVIQYWEKVEEDEKISSLFKSK